MWIVLALLFVAGWLALEVVWGVASFAIHFLLVAAIAAVVLHFLRKHGTRGRGGTASHHPAM